MSLELAHRYIAGVQDGSIVSNEYVRLAVERHLSDLDTAKERGLYFDESEAKRAIHFFTNLRHTKGAHAKTKFNLQPFQAFFIAMVDGWRRDDGTRRFRKAYLSIARKNGKTELASGYSLKSAFADHEEGAECYFAATKSDQAKIGFDAARIQWGYMADESDYVATNSRKLQHSIDVFGTNSVIRYVGADSSTMDGYNPHYVSLDEYHAHPTDGVLNVFESGMGARLQPLMLITTTAGFNINGPCYHYERVMMDILRGIKHDDTEFGMIFSIDDGDDWHDEAVWDKPNPNMDQSVSREYLRDRYKKAVNQGVAKEVDFKTKNLNIWTSSSSTWIADRDVVAVMTDFNPDDLRGQVCYGGLDLASVRDLCSFVLLFPGDIHKVIAFHWCPDETIDTQEVGNRFPYKQWVAEGALYSTPGRSTDYDYIRQTVNQLGLKYNIRSIAYDPHNASQLVNQLQDDGFRLNPFRQGFLSMSTPTKELERKILARELSIGKSSILRWQFGNVALRIDPAGNIKVDKERSADKVDGIVSLVMALGEYMEHTRNHSPYEERGIRTL